MRGNIMFKPVTEEVFNELRINAEKLLQLHKEQIEALQARLAALESKSTKPRTAAKS
jgi:hypothetical protein